MSRHRSWLRTLLLPFAVSAVLGGTKLLAESSPHGIWFVVAAASLIALADLLADAHVAVAAFVYGSATQMVAAVVASALALALLLSSTGGSALETRPVDAFACFGVGALVGLAVRSRFLASCDRRRAGEDTSSVRLHTAIAIGLMVLLTPGDRFGVGGPSWYTLGFGGGFLMHFGARRAEQRFQRVLKLARQVLEALNAFEAPPLNSVEYNAIKLFARRRWAKLRDLLDRYEAPSNRCPPARGPRREPMPCCAVGPPARVRDPFPWSLKPASILCSSPPSRSTAAPWQSEHHRGGPAFFAGP